jgi:hypothetical protein
VRQNKKPSPTRLTNQRCVLANQLSELVERFNDVDTDREKRAIDLTIALYQYSHGEQTHPLHHEDGRSVRIAGSEATAPGHFQYCEETKRHTHGGMYPISPCVGMRKRSNACAAQRSLQVLIRVL